MTVDRIRGNHGADLGSDDRRGRGEADQALPPAFRSPSAHRRQTRAANGRD